MYVYIIYICVCLLSRYWEANGLFSHDLGKKKKAKQNENLEHHAVEHHFHFLITIGIPSVVSCLTPNSKIHMYTSCLWLSTDMPVFFSVNPQTPSNFVSTLQYLLLSSKEGFGGSVGMEGEREGRKIWGGELISENYEAEQLCGLRVENTEPGT